MAEVELPSGDVIEFPDSMADDEIRARAMATMEHVKREGRMPAAVKQAPDGGSYYTISAPPETQGKVSVDSIMQNGKRLEVALKKGAREWNNLSLAERISVGLVTRQYEVKDLDARARSILGLPVSMGQAFGQGWRDEAHGPNYQPRSVTEGAAALAGQMVGGASRAIQGAFTSPAEGPPPTPGGDPTSRYRGAAPANTGLRDALGAFIPDVIRRKLPGEKIPYPRFLNALEAAERAVMGVFGAAVEAPASLQPPGPPREAARMTGSLVAMGRAPGMTPRPTLYEKGAAGERLWTGRGQAAAREVRRIPEPWEANVEREIRKELQPSRTFEVYEPATGRTFRQERDLPPAFRGEATDATSRDPFGITARRRGPRAVTGEVTPADGFDIINPAGQTRRQLPPSPRIQALAPPEGEIVESAPTGARTVPIHDVTADVSASSRTAGPEGATGFDIIGRGPGVSASRPGPLALPGRVGAPRELPPHIDFEIVPKKEGQQELSLSGTAADVTESPVKAKPAAPKWVSSLTPPGPPLSRPLPPKPPAEPGPPIPQDPVKAYKDWWAKRRNEISEQTVDIHDPDEALALVKGRGGLERTQDYPGFPKQFWQKGKTKGIAFDELVDEIATAQKLPPKDVSRALADTINRFEVKRAHKWDRIRKGEDVRTMQDDMYRDPREWDPPETTAIGRVVPADPAKPPEPAGKESWSPEERKQYDDFLKGWDEMEGGDPNKPGPSTPAGFIPPIPVPGDSDDDRPWVRALWRTAQVLGLAAPVFGMAAMRGRGRGPRRPVQGQLEGVPPERPAAPQRGLFEPPGTTAAPVTFGGIQQGVRGMTMELWHLTEDIPGHPKGSTVSRRTLEEAGYTVPPAPGGGSRGPTPPLEADRTPPVEAPGRAPGSQPGQGQAAAEPPAGGAGRAAVGDPPLQEGFVRLYRGEGSRRGGPIWKNPSMNEAAGRWFTTDRAAAEGFVEDANSIDRSGRLLYVDVPGEVAASSTGHPAYDPAPDSPIVGQRLLSPDWAAKAEVFPRVETALRYERIPIGDQAVIPGTPGRELPNAPLRPTEGQRGVEDTPLYRRLEPPGPEQLPLGEEPRRPVERVPVDPRFLGAAVGAGAGAAALRSVDEDFAPPGAPENVRLAGPLGGFGRVRGPREYVRTPGEPFHAPGAAEPPGGGPRSRFEDIQPPERGGRGGEPPAPPEDPSQLASTPEGRVGRIREALDQAKEWMGDQYRYRVSPKISRWDRLGEGGRNITRRVLAVDRDRGKMEGEIGLPVFRQLKDLSPAEAENFRQVVEGEVERPMNGRVSSAVDAFQRVMGDDESWVPAGARQRSMFVLPRGGERRPFQTRDNFFPHEFTEQFQREVIQPGSQRRNDSIQHLVQSGQAADAEQAAAMIDTRFGSRTMTVGGQRYVLDPDRFVGGLERERDLNMPGYITDPATAFWTRFRKVARRFAELDHYGQGDGTIGVPGGSLERAGGGQYHEVPASGLIGQIQRTHGKKAADDAFHLFIQQIGTHPEGTEGARATARRFTTIEAMKDLPMATIANASQEFVQGPLRTNVSTMAAGMKRAVTAEGRAAAERLGIFSERVLNQVRETVTGQTGEEGGTLDRVSGKVMYTFNKQEQINQIIGINAGHAWADTLTERMQRGGSRQQAWMRRELNNLEFTPAEIESILRERRFTPDQADHVAWNINDQINFAARSARRSEWASTPVGSVVLMYKGFVANSGRLLKRHVVEEARAGNFAPLARLLVIAPIVGEGVQDVRALISGTERPDALHDRILDDLTAVAGLGVASSYMESLIRGGLTATGEFVMGPALSTAGRMASKLAGVVKAADSGDGAAVERAGKQVGFEFVKDLPYGRPVAQRLRSDPQAEARAKRTWVQRLGFDPEEKATRAAEVIQRRSSKVVSEANRMAAEGKADEANEMLRAFNEANGTALKLNPRSVKQRQQRERGRQDPDEALRQRQQRLRPELRGRLLRDLEPPEPLGR